MRIISFSADGIKNAAKKGWMAEITYWSTSGLKNVCIGTSYGSTKQFYMDRPMQTGDAHGTAGFIWGAVGIIRMLTPPVVHTADRPAISPARLDVSAQNGLWEYNLQGRVIGKGRFSHDVNGAGIRGTGVVLRETGKKIAVDYK